MHKSRVALVGFLVCAAVAPLAAAAQSAKPVTSLESFSAREHRFWATLQNKDIEASRKMVTDE
jgi:hypothetical protein